MNKKELVERVAENSGQPIVVCKEMLNIMLDSVVEGLKEEGEVSLGKLGKLKTVERAARKGRNPQTGEEMDIPAKVVPKFTPSKTLKETVNS